MSLIPKNVLVKRILFSEKKINNWTENFTRFTLNYSNIAYKAETFFLLYTEQSRILLMNFYLYELPFYK